ncbi:MAG: PEP-CTERM system TPR-repeat protein PrsT [Halioglobus sp.]|nr:PEP-CTERM system TPR-repeat protein PrsT [Halioglobus sp.]
MNKLITKCFVVVSVFLVVSCARDMTSEERIAKARDYIAVGDYASANIELKSAALKDPGNAEIRSEMVGVAVTLGDGAAAEKEIRRAVELGMPPEQLTLLLVSAIYLQGDFERVILETEHFPVQLEGPFMADILAYRAHAQMQLQQYKLADATIAEALNRHNSSALAVHAKASYEAQVGRSETAMTLAKKAVEIAPGSTEAWALIGDLYAAEGALPEAVEAYDKAIESREYASLVLARRALVLAQLKKYRAANADIRWLQGAGYSNEPYVNFVKGYIAFRQSNYAAATAALEKSVGFDEENPLSKLYLVASYLEEGKLEQAQVIANQLYYTIPNSVEVARMFASLNIRQQDFGAAKDRLGTLLEVQEDDAVALGMLGSMALMEGKGDEAVGYLQRLSVLSPDDESVQKMLNLAMTMRGDYISEVTSALEQQVASEDYDRMLLSAAAALKQGQLKEAVAIAENLQQQFPDSVGPLKMLASIHLSVNDWRTGQALLEQTLLLDPLEPSAVKTLAKIYLSTGEEARAMTLISAYLKAFPNDKEAIGIRAELIVATRDYEEAEKYLIESRDQDSGNLELQARLATLYFENGRYEQVSVLTESMSDDDIRMQPALMELRGKSLYILSNEEGAANVWDKWVDLAPDSVLANFYKGDSLAKAGQLELALQSLEVSRELKPLYLPARIAIVRVTAQAGDMEKAFAEMQQLRSELREERGDIWYTQGWLEVMAGDYAEAAQSLQKSVSIEPTPETVVLLVSALNSEGEADEALAALESGLDTFPRNTGLIAILGQTYISSDETEKAIVLYQRLLEITPESVLALNNLAWLLRDENPPQALEYATRASALAPEDPYVLSTMSVLLVGAGQTAEGEQMLRKAVALNPGNMQVKLDLGELLMKLGNAASAEPYLTAVIQRGQSEAQVAEATSLLQSINP